MDKTQMAKADFVTAILLILGSLYIMIATLFFPRFEEWGGIYTNPGFVPFLLAMTLMLMSLYLLIRSIRGQGHKIRLWQEAVIQPIRTDRAHRFLICLGLFVAYYLLLGLIPFWFDTILYLFVSILIFGKGRWIPALLVAIAASSTIYFLFFRVFLVPLP